MEDDQHHRGPGRRIRTDAGAQDDEAQVGNG